MMTDTMFRQVIEDLVSHYQFDTYLNNEKSFWEWLGDVGESKLCENGYCIYTGASRAVITHDSWDSVLKFCIYPIDEDDEGYCANEVFLYEQAKKWGVEAAFAPCRYVGNCCGHRFYEMELCDCDSDALESASWNLQFQLFCDELGLDRTSEDSHEQFWSAGIEAEDSSAMFELAASEWSWPFFNKVQEFCSYYGINDTHSGNWGRLGGNLLLVDYAGYGEGARIIATCRKTEGK